MKQTLYKITWTSAEMIWRQLQSDQDVHQAVLLNSQNPHQTQLQHPSHQTVCSIRNNGPGLLSWLNLHQNLSVLHANKKKGTFDNAGSVKSGLVGDVVTGAHYVLRTPTNTPFAVIAIIKVSS